MTVLSIDLAHKSYTDIGVCSLTLRADQLDVTPIRLSTMGLRGRPVLGTLAEVISEIADKLGAKLIFLDGPQAWKAPENGLLHSRVCERQLFTQGKTGLPGSTKPANYVSFISFSIELFDALSEAGWPRLLDTSNLDPAGRFALESFPTSAWRSVGLKPLPGKARTPAASIPAKLAELCSLFPISAPWDLSHDELQAVVAGIAGIAIEGHSACSYSVAGVAPFELEGAWREGFIVNPASRTETRQAQRALRV